VWLVGASTGIGRATASACMRRGSRVHLGAQPAALDSFVAEHPGAVALPLDACDRDAVRAAAQAILAQGPLDCVMYCAGYYRELRATEFNLDEMLRHEQVNYVGALHVLDAVLPHLLARRSGHISLVSSVAGYRGLPKSLAYGPTKAALINLGETLYVDLRPAGHWREPGQPRLCGDAADRAKPVPHARAHHTRAGRAGDPGRLAARAL
jgi:NAD(P)-dependent dehydrogenase (short-subunit alcohol dehydrogenase family)